MDWMGLLFILAFIAGIIFLVLFIRNNPDKFDRGQVSKSITTLGYLALILIAVIVVCILLTK